MLQHSAAAYSQLRLSSAWASRLWATREGWLLTDSSLTDPWAPCHRPSSHRQQISSYLSGPFSASRAVTHCGVDKNAHASMASLSAKPSCGCLHAIKRPLPLVRIWANDLSPLLQTSLMDDSKGKCVEIRRHCIKTVSEHTDVILGASTQLETWKNGSDKSLRVVREQLHCVISKPQFKGKAMPLFWKWTESLRVEWAKFLRLWQENTEMVTHAHCTVLQYKNDNKKW